MARLKSKSEMFRRLAAGGRKPGVRARPVLRLRLQTFWTTLALMADLVRSRCSRGCEKAITRRCLAPAAIPPARHPCEGRTSAKRAERSESGAGAVSEASNPAASKSRGTRALGWSASLSKSACDLCSNDEQRAQSASFATLFDLVGTLVDTLEQEGRQIALTGIRQHGQQDRALWCISGYLQCGRQRGAGGDAHEDAFLLRQFA